LAEDNARAFDGASGFSGGIRRGRPPTATQGGQRTVDPLDPVAAATGVTALLGAAAAWRCARRARRAETEVERLRRELRDAQHAAGHDQLTGLPNRRAFYRHGSSLVATSVGSPMVAVLVDLDDFKRVNDTLGHAVGDHVLTSVARRFADIVANGGSRGLVARLGGDEFVGLMNWPRTDDGWLRRVARRLADALAAPVDVAGHRVVVTASVGLTPVHRPADLNDVIRRADAAMYAAKRLPGRFFVDGGQPAASADRRVSATTCSYSVS
jgi:diguanylate cyclase (GGDEF)-like protein